jgi:diguanylate cyclase (GGDEF)-like protein
LGSNGGDVASDYSTFISSIHESDRHEVKQLMERTTMERVPFRAEFRFIRPDGEVRWLAAQAQPLFDATGRTIRLIGITKDVTERKQAEAVIERAAFFDLLTSLPNRNKLHDTLQDAIREDDGRGNPICLLLMDLNNFKEINDTLGHVRGDAVLKEVAQRLQLAVAAPDLVARLGGDEFAILLPKANQSTGIAEVLRRIQGALHAPIMIDGLPIVVEVGIGVASYPENGRDADSLLRRADIAMYAAKKSGAGHVVYEAKDDQHSPARLSLLAELRDAIEQNQLVLHYQPTIDLATGKVCAAEALVRWKHPRRGLVPPDTFIVPAERTGLIHPLTEWVMLTAVRQCAAWRQHGLRIPLAINLSARSLFDPLLPERILTVLRENDVSPELLGVEITESAIMADPARAREILLKVRQIGIQVSIDDFGMGYSSLGYLRQLPVGGLKVDKSFVINMAKDGGDAAIVRSTIDLAHNLGLQVVAEGVETRAVYDQLVEWNCDRAQGYLMGRPMALEEFSVWLQQSAWGGGA